MRLRAQRRRLCWSAGLASAAAALVLGGAAGAASAAPAATGSHPTAAAGGSAAAPHIMTIMMENTDYSQFAGSPAMPYLNELAHQYAVFSQAYGWHYPSLPNYLELLSGSHEGVHSDCDIANPRCSDFTNPTLVDQLEAAGFTWHAYYQGLDNGCDQGDGSGYYPYWHNPFRYFADFAAQCGHISSMKPLLPDLSGPHAADYNWVVPDLVNSGGDNGTMTSGDNWLSTELPQIMNTPWYRQGGQIVILYDTGYNDSGGVGGATAGQIPMIVVSAHTAGMGVVTRPVTTAGVLRSVEHAYGLPYLGNAASRVNGT
jgi:phosphatidylinositol-3-phosphatase